MRRFHVDDAIPEALVGARAPVVDLVRVEHDHLPRQAHPARPAVIEGLHASVRQADRVGVVPVLRVRGTGEPRAKQLHPADWPVARDPGAGALAARSFKTCAARSGLLRSHGGEP